MKAPALHLGPTHPLAEIAAGHCTSHVAPLVGGVACGACWEQAIRDDERVVVDFELSRDLVVDPSAVDEIAVERACDGDHVALTEPELVAAIQVLRGRGLSMHDFADRLQAPDRVVFREVGGTRAPGRQA